jgi:hypothetical protein
VDNAAGQLTYTAAEHFAHLAAMMRGSILTPVNIRPSKIPLMTPHCGRMHT